MDDCRGGSWHTVYYLLAYWCLPSLLWSCTGVAATCIQYFYLHWCKRIHYRIEIADMEFFLHKMNLFHDWSQHLLPEYRRFFGGTARTFHNMKYSVDEMLNTTLTLLFLFLKSDCRNTRRSVTAQSLACQTDPAVEIHHSFMQNCSDIRNSRVRWVLQPLI